MVVGLRWGYMVRGFLGEDLSVFGICCRESFLWLRRLRLHGQVGGHGQLVEGGSSKRSHEPRATPLDAVDDERIDGSFHKVFGGFGGEVPAQAGQFFLIWGGFFPWIYSGGGRAGVFCKIGSSFS